MASHVRGREEVGAHDPAGVLQHGRDVVDVEAARVGADEAVGLRVLLDVQEDLLKVYQVRKIQMYLLNLVFEVLIVIYIYTLY